MFFFFFFLLRFSAIASLKLEAVESTVLPVTAEFIPLKKDCSDTEVQSTNKKEKDTKDEILDPLDLQLCTFDNSNLETKVPNSLDFTEFEPMSEC